jgi:hypothetical protein
MTRKKSRERIYDTARAMLIYDAHNAVPEDSMWYRATRFYVKPNGECFVHYIDRAHEKDALEVMEQAKFEILLRNYGCEFSFEEAMARACPPQVHVQYNLDTRLHHKVCAEAKRLGLTRSEFVSGTLWDYFRDEAGA